MKTIKIIDLLNEENNGNIIKKIKYNHIGYEFDEEQCDWFNYDEQEGLLDNLTVLNQLNDEVEIIEEEKKIEPLAKLGNYKIVNTGDDFLDKVLTNINERINHLIDKQTEIIDALNEIRKEK